ncbi:MAG: hypothetical protein CSB55_01200 [Candidatus Cloacimonadota bacterium]|nr:MAG: hypothetical protein CSB55_01200 [Candidatus Cloacimonadota bacterium]
MIKESKRFPNIKIYGFGDTDYPDNTAHYKNLTHYHYGFNTVMLQYISKNKGLLTSENTEKYLDVFTRKSLNFDLDEIACKIEKYYDDKQ